MRHRKWKKQKLKQKTQRTDIPNIFHFIYITDDFGDSMIKEMVLFKAENDHLFRRLQSCDPVDL